jgi:hypothetical protein
VEDSGSAGAMPSLPEESEESLYEGLFRLRLSMARARMHKTLLLQSQLDQLDADYRRNSYNLNLQIMSAPNRQLESFFDREVLSGQGGPRHPEALWAGVMLDFSKTALDYFLREKEEVMKKFRMEISIQGRSYAEYDELIRLIFRESGESILSLLSPFTREALNGYGQNTDNQLYEYFLVCQSYPHLRDVPVDIYNREQLDAFYGHLLATISGIGRPGYDLYHQKKQALLKEQELYAPKGRNLPSAWQFGRLREPMKIFLLRESFRKSLDQNSAGALIAPPSDPLAPQAFLQEFEDSPQSESRALAERFSSTPPVSRISAFIRKMIGQTTRQGMIDELGDRLGPEEVLLQKLFSLMTSIRSLELLAEKTGQPEIPVFAYQLGRDLFLLLKAMNMNYSVFKTAGQDFHHIGIQLDELVRLAEYSVKRLKSS